MSDQVATKHCHNTVQKKNAFQSCHDFFHDRVTVTFITLN